MYIKARPIPPERSVGFASHQRRPRGDAVGSLDRSTTDPTTTTYGSRPGGRVRRSTRACDQMDGAQDGITYWPAHRAVGLDGDSYLGIDPADALSALARGQSLSLQRAPKLLACLTIKAVGGASRALPHSLLGGAGQQVGLGLPWLGGTPAGNHQLLTAGALLFHPAATSLARRVRAVEALWPSLPRPVSRGRPRRRRALRSSGRRPPRGSFEG